MAMHRPRLTYVRRLATPFAPKLCERITLEIRGRREDRTLAAPMARVQKKSTRQNHGFGLKRPAFPARQF